MKYVKNVEEVLKIIDDMEYLIIDFDGTIANTEKFHWLAYNRLLDKYNVHLKDSDINKYIGNSEFLIYEMIKKDFNITFDDKLFLNDRLDIFIKLANEYNLEPHEIMKDLIISSKQKKIILSSQKRKIIKYFLKKWELLDKFENIHSVIDDGISKDEMLSLYSSKYKCALFEDSPKTISLAQNYDIVTFGVINQYTDTSNADYSIQV